VVTIHDTGCGIPQRLLERVFDPFFTTKQAATGTGLGLFISHGLIKGMGGDITVESEIGRGTTFRVALPLAGASPGERAAAASNPGPDHPCFFTRSATRAT
jgi:signal transduction histidine kinase